MLNRKRKNPVKNKTRSIETKTTLEDGTQIEFNKPISKGNKRKSKKKPVSVFAKINTDKGFNNVF